MQIHCCVESGSFRQNTQPSNIAAEKPLDRPPSFNRSTATSTMSNEPSRSVNGPSRSFNEPSGSFNETFGSFKSHSDAQAAAQTQPRAPDTSMRSTSFQNLHVPVSQGNFTDIAQVYLWLWPFKHNTFSCSCSKILHCKYLCTLWIEDIYR